MKTIACVIPNFNDATTLRRALLTVCTNHRKPDDVLILDDCSTDDSDEVIRRYCKEYPFVRAIRYDEKADDWRKSACLNALNLTTCDYIHSLSANDYIDEHFYLAAHDCRDEGFIFGEYTVIVPDGNRMGVATCEMLPGNREYPQDVLLEQLCHPRFFEGGPTALVRRDAWKWLCDREFWKLGTWQDSVGYSAAAWHFGASYIPFPCGFFTYDPSSDGETKKREESVPLYMEAFDFLEGVGLPERLKECLKQKVYVTVPDDLKSGVPAPKDVQPEPHWLNPNVMLKEYRRALRQVEKVEPEWLRWQLLRMLYWYVPRYYRQPEMVWTGEEAATGPGGGPVETSVPSRERTLASDEARITASSGDLP